MSHLWDHQHPYYWNEGNFFRSGWHFTYPSWADFMTEMGSSDDDLNLLCRWDWDLETDEDGNAVQPLGTGTVKLGFVLQRKAIVCSYHVRVDPDDEPVVRGWLQARWRKMQELWAGTGECPAAPEETS